MSLLPNLDQMTDNEKLAVLESIQKSIAESKEIQKKKIGENVDLVVQALKKIEADIRDRFDAVGSTIEKRVASIQDGQDGKDGKDGRDGKDGKSGRDGLKGDKGADGQAGRDGVDGVDGVSVVNANIDFDGSLIISLSDGRELNVGEVVSADIAEKIKVISTMSTNGAIAVKEEGTTITSGVKSFNFVGTGITATTSGDDVTVTVASGSGTVTSVAATAGTGISITGSPITTSGTLNITNTAPDQTVVLTAGTGINTSGTYPSFTVTNSAPDQTVALTAGTGISTSGTYPNFTIINSAPDQTVALTQGGTTTITGTYPNFTISSADQFQGTVTSVTGTSPVASSGGATPDISLAASYGDTQNPYASKTANYVLAAPNGASGVPTFRAIVAADIPTLNQNTTGTASNVTGTVAIANGGTGQTTATAAFDALAPSQTSNSGKYLTTNGTTTSWATISATGTVTSVAATVPSFLSISGSPITTSGTLAISLSGTALPVANGGTGVTTSTGSGANVLGTSPSISGAVLSSMASSVITSGTSVSATGTSVNFTSIPSWVKRITVMLIGVSGNGSSMPTIRLGDAGGIEASGYSGSTQTSGSAVLISTGFDFAGTYQSAARVYHGAMTLSLQNSSTNTWVASAVIALGEAASVLITAGSKSLSQTLDRVSITFTNGTDSFDAGTINILFE